MHERTILENLALQPVLYHCSRSFLSSAISQYELILHLIRGDSETHIEELHKRSQFLTFVDQPTLCSFLTNIKMRNVSPFTGTTLIIYCICFTVRWDALAVDLDFFTSLGFDLGKPYKFKVWFGLFPIGCRCDALYIEIDSVFQCTCTLPSTEAGWSKREHARHCDGAAGTELLAG